MNSLNISSWNANGLRNRISELINYIHCNNIDIMMINETRFNSQINFKVKGYKCIRRDRSSAAGGILMLIKNNIPYKEAKHEPHIPIENISIKLASGIHLIAAYNSPNKVFSACDLDKLLNVSNRVLLIGDLNARHKAWECHLNNKRGRILLNYTLTNNLIVIFPDEPTHFPENGATPTIIDIGINKNITNISNINVIKEMSSDHNPISFSLGSQIKNISDKLVYDYDMVDWNKFRQILNEKITMATKIKTPQELEIEVQKFTTIINNCIKNIIPVKTAQQLQDKLPSIILQMIKYKNKMRKKWQITRNPVYKIICNSITKTIRIDINKYKNDIWAKKLIKIHPRDNSLWRMTKIF